MVWVQAAAAVASAALSKKGEVSGGGGPTSTGGNTIDGAGFVVNFRGVQTASASPTSAPYGVIPGAAAAGLGSGPVLAVLAVAGIAVWLTRRRGRQ